MAVVQGWMPPTIMAASSKSLMERGPVGLARETSANFTARSNGACHQ